jgi:hypothetical protein
VQLGRELAQELRDGKARVVLGHGLEAELAREPVQDGGAVVVGGVGSALLELGGAVVADGGAELVPGGRGWALGGGAEVGGDVVEEGGAEVGGWGGMGVVFFVVVVVRGVSECEER